jgi:hypothetical protein
VKYVHSILDIEPAGEAAPLRIDSLPGTLYRLERPLPRAYVVPSARWLPDNVAVINDVLAPGFDPRSTVVLEGAPPPDAADLPAPPPSPPGPAGPSDTTGGPPIALPAPAGFPGARITLAGDDEVRVRVDPARDGYLVLTDNHYPGWEAAVDGEPRPIELANFFFRAVRVRPGDREVVFRYRSLAFERGRLASVIGLVVALVWLLAAELRARWTLRGG